MVYFQTKNTESCNTLRLSIALEWSFIRQVGAPRSQMISASVLKTVCWFSFHMHQARGKSSHCRVLLQMEPSFVSGVSEETMLHVILRVMSPSEMVISNQSWHFR